MKIQRDQFKLDYMPGFRNDFSTEALAGALPDGQNSPQKAPLGLYAEQISGTAFTAPRAQNFRSWLYRRLPSVAHEGYKPYSGRSEFQPELSNSATPPDQFRWDPISLPKIETSFVDGLVTMAGTGSADSRIGILIHHYAINASMPQQAISFADSETMIVPENGNLTIRTEFGIIGIEPTEIAVIPRGVKFQVNLNHKTARGYFCENYSAPFTIPDLGPIGANGLANSRDFLTPIAAFEDNSKSFTCFTKFQNRLWTNKMKQSPFDVVAWHGNYAPYKYDLKKFNTINTVSFDHPDPSIFTVLTSQTNRAGTANCDFVIFPERWMVAENTFRPPYYHRNIMSEYMGLIKGVYDAKEEGFVPGGASLHNCMSAHGPDANTFERACNSQLNPEKYQDTLAFMFETNLPFKLSDFAMTGPTKQKNYTQCWEGLKPFSK